MFSNPEKNLKVFGLKENDIVADLGAGTGFWAVAAGRIASRGKVYAVEIEKDYLHTIRDKAALAGLKNVEIIWGNVEKLGGSKLGDEIMDVVIASSILFQVSDKEGFIREARRVLKPKGRVLFTDWSEDSVMQKIAVPKGRARAMFEKNGFVFDREIDAGSEHYGMIFRKEKNS